MKDKICLDFICDEALIFSSIATKLEKDGSTICGLVLGNRWPNAWKGKFDITSLDLLDNGIDWDLELARISKQYEKYYPAKFTQADRFISQLERTKQKQILIFTFLKIEELVRSGVTMFVTTGVAYLYNLVILAVSDFNNIKAVSFYGARQPEPRFTYSLSKGGTWPLVQTFYEQLIDDKNIDLTQQLDYIKQFRIKVKAPDYMASARQKGGVKWVFILEFLLRLKRWYLEGWGIKTDYLTQNPFWYVWRDIKRIINKQYLNRCFKFDEKKSKDKFIIYPLHLQPEASTLILGDDYVNQLNTIQAIAKRLPADILLYVKEHPAAYGRHSLDFYKKIKNTYNVRLIHYNENARKLIVNAKAVIVISGTMGWEALLLGTPSIVLGSVFYDNFKGVNKVGSLTELTSILHSSLDTFGLNDSAIALKSVYSGSFPGYFDVHKLDTSKVVLNESNLDALYNGFLKINND